MDVNFEVISTILLLIILQAPPDTNAYGYEEHSLIQQHSSHSHHAMDPSLTVFFFPDDLRPGNTIPIYFPDRDLSDVTRRFLSKTDADSIPFSSQNLRALLEYFSLAESSPQATAMEDTLRQCETRPIDGETKMCPTSLESMLDFGRSIIGSETRLKIISTSHVTHSGMQKYTINGVRKIDASKVVACHTMPYPYTVFYCHYQESESRVYRVSLRGENGDGVEAVGVCHMDTSRWSRNHVSFRVLGVEPGSSPICHFFPGDNVVLIPSISLDD